MSFITRGFTGRGRERDDRLPPGQTLVGDFPVLSAGPTRDIDGPLGALTPPGPLARPSKRALV